MTLSNFADFLAAAHAQPDAQRLLFVFAVAELPHDHTPGQAIRFREGRGGALAPVMCVDKAPAELSDFAGLSDEARLTGQPWDLVFVAALAVKGGRVPATADVDRGLRTMIASVQRGAIGGFLAFDGRGEAVSLS